MTYDNQTINLPENAIETLNDAQKENLKADTLASLGLKKNNYEGLGITIDINDKMIITIDADLDETNPEI